MAAEKVAIVTGGGRGIGKAICGALARSGHKVVINFVANEAAAQQTRNELEAAGLESIALQADVTNRGQVEQMVTRTISAFGRIDVLVNNAGVMSWFNFPDLDQAEFERILRVNLVGPFLTISSVLPWMMKQGQGRIVNMSSTAALNGPPRAVHYAAAKAGLIGLTRSCATEFREFNIAVNAVCPGGTETDMLMPELERHSFQFDSPSLEGPARRLGRSKDIAGAVAFLASDEASWISGSVLVVDGATSLG